VNATRGQDPRDAARQGHDRAEILSALKETLGRALASVPRDQVVKTVVAALPVEILLEDSGRLHGSKVRKVSVSMPEELTEAVRARTGAGGFSRYVTDAVEEQIRLDLMDDLIAEFEAEHGPVPEELVEEAMREWPDYEDE
jgi:Arc/MetJ-type ribon-helix-helix transcriptional regulator